MAKATTLYSPDGRKAVTSSPNEITRLKARGYTEKPPRKSESSEKK